MDVKRVTNAARPRRSCGSPPAAPSPSSGTLILYVVVKGIGALTLAFIFTLAARRARRGRHRARRSSRRCT